MNSYNQLKALGKSLGKYLLPDEVITEYRNQLQKIDRSVLIIVLDSCRYDSFLEAYEEDFPAKNVRQAYSPCHWTMPSHDSIVRGFIPYGDFVDPLEDHDYNYGMPLPKQHNYSFGCTAIPYLSDSNAMMNNLHSYFDDYHCTEDIGSHKEVLDKSATYINESDDEESFFGLINLGETHSPYKDFENQTTKDIIEKLDSGTVSMNELHEWQKNSAKRLIKEISEFQKNIPEGTLVIVTSDHGELFGEENSFGHNPHLEATFHKKIHEVPLIYWTE